MSHIPLVSFIVPCFNYGRYLTECLESIFRQTATGDWELIVVDDASTDETPDVIRAYCDPRLRYTRHTQNRGTSATISDALRLTRGEYVAVLDADDRYRPDFLETVLPIMEQYPDVGMTYGDLAAIDEAGNLLADPWEGNAARRIHQNRAFKGNELWLMLTKNPSASQARLIRRVLLKDELPFPVWLHPRFGPIDWYMSVRLARNHDVYYIPRTLAEYRFHAGMQHQKPRRFYYEETVLHVLDALFAEPNVELQQPGRKRIAYGLAYQRFADQYFSAGNYSAARRCYLQALRLQPRAFVGSGGLHRLIGTGLGEKRYARIKSTLRGLLVRSE